MQQTFFKSIILTSFCGLLASCGSSQILYDYNTKARFSEYETFSWLENTGHEPLLITTVDEYIRTTVSEALEKKGLLQTESGGDLLITYHVGEKRPIDPSQHGYAYWPNHWGYGGYYNGIEKYSYGKGALIVDLIDRRSNELTWRGSAPRVISNAKMEKLQENIDEAVERILVHFPPVAR